MKHLRYIIAFIIVLTALLFAESPSNCLVFEDVDDYVYIEDDPLEFSNRFTLECWFNISEFIDSAALIDFTTKNLHEDYFFGYGIFTMDSNRIAIKMGNFDKSFEMQLEDIKENIWYHLAVSYDKYKNDENVVAYLNGQVVKKADCYIYLEYPETFRPYGVMLGAYYDYPFLRAIKGQLDDVRFWSVVRTREEIRENINKTISNDAMGLQGYYTFDQEADSVLIDSSLNLNHGKLENMTDSSWQLSYSHLAAIQPYDITFDRFVLPWVSSPDFDSYCVDVSIDTSFSASLSGFPIYDVETDYLVLDNVDPGTYYFRVKGHYDGENINTEPWTDIQIVSTMSDASTDIELSKFNLNHDMGSVIINWVTASQTENASFVLEKKQENEDWKIIYSTPGEGTTSEEFSYEFQDTNVRPGTKYFYRLKDISYSGTISVSEVKEITVEEEDLVEDISFKFNGIYPNPFNPETRISFNIYENAMAQISIYSLEGVKIADILKKHLNSGHYEIEWRPTQLSSGVYILNFSISNSSTSYKLLYLK